LSCARIKFGDLAEGDGHICLGLQTFITTQKKTNSLFQIIYNIDLFGTFDDFPFMALFERFEKSQFHRNMCPTRGFAKAIHGADLKRSDD